MDIETKNRKTFLTEKETREFYKKNKSYCSMPFKEIYGDNAVDTNFVVMQNLWTGNIRQLTQHHLSFSFHQKWKK